MYCSNVSVIHTSAIQKCKLMVYVNTIRLTIFNIVPKLREGTKMQQIELTNCDRVVFVRDDYEELLDYDWYEYTDPFSGQVFTAHDTDSGRRVMMHNVIVARDVLDDDEVFEFGSVICTEPGTEPVECKIRGRPPAADPAHPASQPAALPHPTPADRR